MRLRRLDSTEYPRVWGFRPWLYLGLLRLLLENTGLNPDSIPKTPDFGSSSICPRKWEYGGEDLVATFVVHRHYFLLENCSSSLPNFSLHQNIVSSKYLIFTQPSQIKRKALAPRDRSYTVVLTSPWPVSGPSCGLGSAMIGDSAEVSRTFCHAPLWPGD